MDPPLGRDSSFPSSVDSPAACLLLVSSLALLSTILDLFGGHLPHLLIPVLAGTVLLACRAICMGSEAGDLGAAVRDIQDQLRQLTLAVGRLATAISSHNHQPGVGAASSTTSLPGAGSPYRAPSVASSSASTSQVYNELATEIPPVPPHVLELSVSLRRGPADSKERASRAWTIGYWARFVLEGRVSKPRPSPPVGLPNTVYVVIRAPGISSPVVCATGSDYRSLVGSFEGNTLSHGFPSAAEAKIYCAGANIPYPTTIYQWRP